jgi:cephalosporin-C deacetylase-like acetyl esterase
MLTFGSHLDGYHDVADQMIHDLQRRALACLREQDAAKAQLTSVAEFEAHRSRVRAAFLEAIGGLPTERTPLQPEITGRIEQPAYTIEKLIYQSLPEFYVTSLLYLPREREPRAPAVLFVCGHAENAKAYLRYQQVCADLAANGFVVLCMDPPGQGERYQYWDLETGRRIIGGCTTEHTHAGIQYTLQGASVARQFVWDAMRAVDLLSERPEVDPDRIAITGNSGGGTQSVFMMVADQRLAAAAPCTFVMTLESYLKTGQSQDSEQIVRRAFVDGPDHDDYLTCMAPKPVLVGAVASDFFPIEGTMEAVERAKRIYALYGAEAKVALNVAPGRHEYAPGLREGTVNWFRRYLQGREPDFRTTEPPTLPEEELRCTPEGQVLAWRPNSRTVFDIGREFGVRYVMFSVPNDADPDTIRIPDSELPVPSPDSLRDQLADVLGLAGGSPGAVTLSEARARPIYPRIIAETVVEGYPVEKLFFFSEPDVVVTGVLTHPRGAAPATGTEVLLLERGTAAIPDERARLEAILRQRRRVFVFDVRGTGAVETRPINTLGAREAYAPEFRLACDAMMAGTSTLGLRVFDALRAYDYLAARQDTAGSPIGVQGMGTGAILAYLAAALEPGWSEVTLEEMLLSYRSVIETRLYNRRRFTLNSMAWGFLARFDLPDLAACIAPRPLRFVRPVNAFDEPVTSAEWEQVWLPSQEGGGWRPTLL